MTTPAGPARSRFRILTRLFLGRFLENELLSPGADRHDTLAIALGVLISISIFITFFLATKYLSEFIELPGPTAISALSDRFFLIAFSMTITALVTLLMWDALGLEPRDGAILGSLPVPSGEIARAKLAALLLFAAGFSAVFNAATSVMYPVLMSEHFQLRVWEILWLIAAHAASVMLASAFAFLGVLGIRGLLQIVATERWFARLSSLVQTTLIVVVTSALLLLPVVTADVSRDWMRADAQTMRRVLPPLWFLGLCQTLEGRTVVDTAIVVPPRFELPPYMRHRNEQAVATYYGYEHMLHELAWRATSALSLAVVVALATFAWNSRRLPLPATAAPAAGRTRAVAGQWGARAIARHPAVRAGFGFTLQVLFRSPPHRVALSAALAFGLAAAIVLAQAMPASGLLAAQVAVLGALVAGFRHAVRLPATLPANWTIQMAWRGDQRAFLAGARRAGTVALILPPLVVLAPISVASFGWPLAVAHSIVDAVAALALLQTLFIGFNTVPFASPYVALRNPKLLWPLSFGALFLVPSVFASIERDALRSSGATAGLVAVLAIVALAASRVRTDRDAIEESMVFKNIPEEPTQRLGLHERIIS